VNGVKSLFLTLPCRFGGNPVDGEAPPEEETFCTSEERPTFVGRDRKVEKTNTAKSRIKI